MKNVDEKYLNTLIEEFKMLHGNSTKVVNWYAHPDTVRGPYHRWFTISDVPSQYAQHVGSKFDDAKFAAASMNIAPLLVEYIEELNKEIIELKVQLAIEDLIRER